MSHNRHRATNPHPAPRQIVDEAMLRNQQAVTGTLTPSRLTGGETTRTAADGAIYHAIDGSEE